MPMNWRVFNTPEQNLALGARRARSFASGLDEYRSGGKLRWADLNEHIEQELNNEHHSGFILSFAPMKQVYLDTKADAGVCNGELKSVSTIRQMRLRPGSDVAKQLQTLAEEQLDAHARYSVLYFLLTAILPPFASLGYWFCVAPLVALIWHTSLTALLLSALIILSRIVPGPAWLWGQLRNKGIAGSNYIYVWWYHRRPELAVPWMTRILLAIQLTATSAFLAWAYVGRSDWWGGLPIAASAAVFGAVASNFGLRVLRHRTVARHRRNLRSQPGTEFAWWGTSLFHDLANHEERYSEPGVRALSYGRIIELREAAEAAVRQFTEPPARLTAATSYLRDPSLLLASKKERGRLEKYLSSAIPVALREDWLDLPTPVMPRDASSYQPATSQPSAQDKDRRPVRDILLAASPSLPALILWHFTTGEFSRGLAAGLLVEAIALISIALMQSVFLRK